MLGAMQVRQIEQSPLGDTDRQMMDSAFKLGANLVASGDPMLFIDIDDQTIAAQSGTTDWPTNPPVTTPRAVLAEVLGYLLSAPAGKGALAVILDVDIGNHAPGDEAGVAELHAVLERWNKTPGSPPLFVARDPYPASIFQRSGDESILPATTFDDLVRANEKISWSTPRVLVDRGGVIREFAPFECVSTRTGQSTLFSPALLAYATIEGKALTSAPVERWFSEAKRACAGPVSGPLTQGELIDYNLTTEEGVGSPIPNVSRNWPGFKICGDVSPTTFRSISAGDVVSYAPDTPTAQVCRRIVVIGGTNAAANDWDLTPLGMMNGSLILINAIRGLEISGGGLRQLPLWLQLSVLALLSLAISEGFDLAARIRNHYRLLIAVHQRDSPLAKLWLLPFNPWVLGAVFSVVAYLVGVAMLTVAFIHGYWAYFSIPAVAASAAGALQQIFGERHQEKSNRVVTFDEVRQRLGVNEKDLRAIIARGDLPAQKVAGRWLIQSADIEVYLSAPARKARRMAEVRRTRLGNSPARARHR